MPSVPVCSGYSCARKWMCLCQFLIWPFSFCLAYDLRRLLDSFDYRQIARATADVAVHVLFYFRHARRGIFVQKRLGSKNHPWRAVAALESKLIDERLLDRMQSAVRACQAFDGKHLAIAHFIRQQRTGAHRQTIDQYRARPAYLNLAGDFRPRQIQPLAQNFRERFLRLKFDFYRAAVELELDLHQIMPLIGVREYWSVVSCQRPLLFQHSLTPSLHSSIIVWNDLLGP